MSVKSFVVPTSLCSPQTFIVIIILLHVYLTLENSISLHQKIIAQQKKTSEINHLPLPLPRPPPASTHHRHHHHHHQQQQTDDDHQLHEYSSIQHKLTSSSSSPNLSPPPLPPPSLDLESLMIASTGNFYDDFNITWGDGRGKISESGNSLTLSLDRFSGSGFQSKKQFLFAKISIQMKLVANNSAGTVTTYYLSSDKGDHHDEIDFEFLGNLTGQPYTLHTNIYSRGIGNREQQFYLWFDPTADFHTYSILWNPSRIVFYVDGIPIREFANAEDEIGVPFPSRQPMSIFSSLWNADDWATQGGKVKTDWSLAPFVASYRNFKAKGCVWIPDRNTTSCNQRFAYIKKKKKMASDYDDDRKWLEEELDPTERDNIRRVQNKYMTYDYCKDVYRFPKGLPTECKPRQ